MRKKAEKKLTLNKETLKELDREVLAKVEGGGGGSHYCTWDCVNK